MEILLMIFAALFITAGAYLTGYNLGKQSLRQDYKDNYKNIQNERDNCKHMKIAFEEETMKLLKEAYNILSPISLQWKGRETIPGQMFLASLRSAVNPPPQEKKDPISKYYEKILQTNSECKHDYMGTLNPDVKMCRKCPAKKRRKPWELGDSFGESWVEDKKEKLTEAQETQCDQCGQEIEGEKHDVLSWNEDKIVAFICDNCFNNHVHTKIKTKPNKDL